MYEKLSMATTTDPTEVKPAMQDENLGHAMGALTKFQERQQGAVPRAIKGNSHLHPDLQDLTFGALEGEQGNLPAPLRPTTPEEGRYSWQRRGSLSDFSNYEDDDERDHVTVSDDDQERRPMHHASVRARDKLADVDDPFADPFAG